MKMRCCWMSSSLLYTISILLKRFHEEVKACHPIVLAFETFHLFEIVVVVAVSKFGVIESIAFREE